MSCLSIEFCVFFRYHLNGEKFVLFCISGSKRYYGYDISNDIMEIVLLRLKSIFGCLTLMEYFSINFSPPVETYQL